MIQLLLVTIIGVPLAFLIPGLLASLGTTKETQPAPSDPLEVEARRLAAEEVAELDWLLGTGEKPEHVIRAETRC